MPIPSGFVTDSRSEPYKHTPVETNAIGWDENGDLMFVFLKGEVPQGVQNQALNGLKAMHFTNCNESLRKELQRANWFNVSEGQQNPVVAEEVNAGFGARSYIYDLGATKKYHKQNTQALQELKPLLGEMGDKFALVLPKLFGHHNAKVRPPFRLCGTVPFSSLTLLRSAPAAVHVDHNGKKMYACMTSVAPDDPPKYSGGTFCLAQYGLAFAVRPGDLLIAATSEHEHCNLSPVIGEKYSVIAYVKNIITNKRMREEYMACPQNPGGRRFPKRKSKLMQPAKN